MANLNSPVSMNKLSLQLKYFLNGNTQAEKSFPGSSSKHVRKKKAYSYTSSSRYRKRIDTTKFVQYYTRKKSSRVCAKVPQ